MRNLVTRTAWRAQPPTSVTVLLPSRVRYLALHYSGMNADEQSRHEYCAARVRSIQGFHMAPSPSDPSKPWSDIAYTWLVCKHGFIFRGRGWRVRTAASGPANGYTVACCFLGDDTAGRDDVTEAGRAAIREVWAFVKRNAPNVQGVRGHRDFMNTKCPGDELARFARTLS